MIFFSEQFKSREGRQKEAYEAYVQRATDLRARENFRADQVPGWSGTGETGVRAGHDRISSEGKTILLLYCTQHQIAYDYFHMHIFSFSLHC